MANGDDPGARHGSYRVPPPAPADRVAWPAGFGTHFLVLVDTEEEFDWDAPLSRDHRATTAAAALPDAHHWFGGHGIPLSYMIDHPIASDPRAVDLLGEILTDGVSTIGTQLHPWVNPPFDEDVTPFNSFPGNLPRALEAAKLDALTDAITAAFGTAPRAYRAGRYGIGPDTLNLLAERGYRFDSSMRSRYDYSAEGGPNFTDIGNDAFRAGPGGAILELPLTTVFTGLARRLGQGLFDKAAAIPRGRGILARSGLMARVALTPEEMPLADALEAVRVAIGEGVQVLNFSFHSPSLVPGHTPYVRDAADLAAFYHWWEQVIALLGRRGATPIGLDALIEAVDVAGSGD